MCFKPKGVSKKEIILGLEKSRGDLEGDNSHLKLKVSRLEDQLVKKESKCDGLRTRLTGVEADLLSRSDCLHNALLRSSAVHTSIVQLLGSTQAVKSSGSFTGGTQVIVAVECQEPSDSGDHSSVQDGEGSMQGAGHEKVSSAGSADAAPMEGASQARGSDLKQCGMSLDGNQEGAATGSLESRMAETLSLLEQSHSELAQLFLSLSKEQADSSAQVRALERKLHMTITQREQSEEKYKGQLEALESAISALDTQNAALTDMGDELQKQVDQLTAELKAAQQQHAAEVLAAGSLREEMLTVQSSCSTANVELENLQSSLSASQGEVAELQTLNRSLSLQIEKLDRDLGDRDRELEERMFREDAANEQVKDLNHQVDSLTEKLAGLDKELDSLNNDLEVAGFRIADLEEEVNTTKSTSAALTMELQEAKASFASAQSQVDSLNKELGVAGLRIASLEEEANASKCASVACTKELQEAKASLASVQSQLAKSMRDLSTSTLALSTAQQRAMDADTRLQESNIALESSKASLQEMTAQYMATKKDLINTTKQMADIARNHNKALDKMGNSDTQMHSTQIQLQEVQASLASATTELSVTKSRLAEVDASWHALEAEAAALRASGGLLERELMLKRALLAAIAQLPRTHGSTSQSGKERAEEAAMLEGTYHAAMAEDVLRLKVCDAPLPLCGSLLGAIMDSEKLTHLALDVDTSRDAVWEMSALRTASLAAALGLNHSLQSLELTGWTWDEGGSGSALAFMCLGTPEQAVPGAGSAAIMSSLTSVKIDTRLFDKQCAKLLCDLLQQGIVQLKRPNGKGVLRIFSDNESLDEWYGLLIQHAVEPAGYASGALSQKAPPASCNTSNTTMSRLSAQSSFSSTCTTHYQHSASFTSTAQQQALSARKSSAMVERCSMWLETDHESANGTFSAAAGAAHHHLLHSTSKSGLQGGGEAGEGQGVPSVDSDLSNEALESHHMIAVMVVLLTCPHLRRLRIDGNKIGDAGAEMLSVGLAHNGHLRELGLARNSIWALGGKSIASALQSNSTLLKLDLSGQRSEGLGPAGAEACATIFSRRHSVSALEELDLSGCSIGPAGGAALASALRSVSLTRGPLALKKLRVQLNGLDAAVSKDLKAAAAEHNVSVSL